MSIRVDESGWPLVVMSWPNGPVTDADVEEFIEHSSQLLARRERFATLHDGVETAWIQAHQRARMTEHVNVHRSELERWHVAVAIVIGSAIARAFISSMNWVAPPPSPQRQFATRAEAETWLRDVLRADAEARATRDP